MAATIVAGLLDGKIRFRKVTTPILMKKIYISGLFFILSFVKLYAVCFMPASKTVLTGGLVLISLCFICTILLGFLGVKLLNSKFPG